MSKAYGTKNAETPTMQTDQPRSRAAFNKMRVFIGIYGALSILVLLANVVLAAIGREDEVSTFMWARSSIIVASAPFFYWLTINASRGAQAAYRRVRIISIILPIAVVVVDLIPGVSPPWFTICQSVCALPLAAVAFIVNTPHLRRTFAEAR